MSSLPVSTVFLQSPPQPWGLCSLPPAEPWVLRTECRRGDSVPPPCWPELNRVHVLNDSAEGGPFLLARHLLSIQDSCN